MLEALARLRTPALTRVMEALAALGSRTVIVVLGWATILVLVAVRRFRRAPVMDGEADAMDRLPQRHGLVQ